jgi:hypothetical protein
MALPHTETEHAILMIANILTLGGMFIWAIWHLEQLKPKPKIGFSWRDYTGRPRGRWISFQRISPQNLSAERRSGPQKTNDRPDGGKRDTTGTIDHVAIDIWGNTATNTRTVLIEIIPPIVPTNEASTTASSSPPVQ